MVVSAYPALTASMPAAASVPATTPTTETYDARGAEPGWMIRIDGGRIHYAGDYSDQRVDVARPQPVERSDGRHYETAQIALDVSYERCNDAMSGRGFEHRVTVTVGEQVMRGCGGARRADWDL